MLAFTRTPPDDQPRERHELLLADADDALVPLRRQSRPPGSPDTTTEPATSAPQQRMLGARSTLACAQLVAFLRSDEPCMGWRHALWLVCGIRLRPARGERVLRAVAEALLEGVDPLILDTDMETS